MITYNVIYNKEIPVGIVRKQLEFSGAIVNKMFPRMHVMNISSDTLDFTNLSSIVAWEEDTTISVEPSTTYWHKLRIVSYTLPMNYHYLFENDGGGVKVYLVDSGINKNFDEFTGADIVDCYSYNGDFSDEVGHGTSLASLIVGKTLGVSPGVQLKNVKIKTGVAMNISELLTAFDAILQDKTDPNEIAVINCSWVITKSMILDTKINEMQDSNFVVVAAAGNSVTAADTWSPVGLDTVLGVGASDAYDRVINWTPAAGSNWGPEVDLFAPGIDVASLMLDGTIHEGSGTSIAAAITSAAVAQTIKSLDPSYNLTAYHVQFMIVGGAVPDVLFRNETIYGTTPNRLLHVYSFSKVIKNPIFEVLNVQVGTEYQYKVELDERYAVSIDIDNVILGRIPRTYPDWISIDKSTNTIKFAPTSPAQNTRIWFKAMDTAGEVMQIQAVVINPYLVSPDENPSEEVYEYRGDGDTITVYLADCTGGCAGTCIAIPPKGMTCGCTGQTGFCFTTY